MYKTSIHVGGVGGWRRYSSIQSWTQLQTQASEKIYAAVPLSIEKFPRSALNSGLGGPQLRCEWLGEENIVYPCRVMESDFSVFHRVSLVTVPTKTSRFKKLSNKQQNQ